MTRSACDIILPVYSGLAYVRRCIESVLAYTPASLYHLYVMDDCGDSTTAAYLQDTASRHANFTYIRNERNLGFVRNCNKGMALGSAPFTLLLNSDIIVTPQWLEHLLECAALDEKIAAVNPFTNHAANIGLSLAPGLSFLDMNRYLGQHARGEPADVVTSVGFCLLLRRAALEQVGLFDEIYGMGYCEESDLAMRFTTHGWRTVLAQNVYVYHKGSGTFTDPGERYRVNRKLFDARWKKIYSRQFKAFRKEDPLRHAKELFHLNSKFAPFPALRTTYMHIRNALSKRQWKMAAYHTIRGMVKLPTSRVPILSDAYFARYKPESGALRVTYILPTLAISGGILSVLQLVNELILLGVDARIATLSEKPGIRDWPLYTEPLIYNSVEEMAAAFPPSDIIVATHWKTAEWADAILKSGNAAKSVYFLQDYESWFYPEEDTVNRKKVQNTYRIIQNKIVKSDWLGGMLQQDGYDTKKIHLGMNLDVFYPRDVARPPAPIIMAMARPDTPWRGYEYVVESLRLVKKLRSDAHILLFGSDIDPASLPFQCEISGVITNQNMLAQYYSKADIFLDGSTFQGFGRPALEAMACGTACVLTNVGGVNEYARDMENCLLVPPQAPEAFAKAILKLLEDATLRTRIKAGGRATAQHYCMRREARETLVYFEELARKKPL